MIYSNENVLLLLKTLQTTITNTTNVKCNITINHIRKQTSNTECGMYSCYFIINMLKPNMTFNKLLKTKFTDTLMKKYRNIYYR